MTGLGFDHGYSCCDGPCMDCGRWECSCPACEACGVAAPQCVCVPCAECGTYPDEPCDPFCGEPAEPRQRLRWLIQSTEGRALITFASGGVSTSVLRAVDVPYLNTWWDAQ